MNAPNQIQFANADFFPHVRRCIAEGHTVTMNVKGRSMRPFLEDGRDAVTLAPVRELAVGDAILFEDHPGHYVLHRIIRIDGDHLIMMGDGNVRGQEHCRRSDVLGIVTHYIYPDHTKRAEELRHWVRLWCWLCPIRRYLLFIYRKVWAKE